MNYYIQALKNYANFQGRATRSEYWFFFLFNILIAVAIAIVAQFIHPVAILSMVYGLAMLIPGLSVCVRRLHDSGRSGWWIFIALVPVIGAIVLLVFMCLPSK